MLVFLIFNPVHKMDLEFSVRNDGGQSHICPIDDDLVTLFQFRRLCEAKLEISNRIKCIPCILSMAGYYIFHEYIFIIFFTTCEKKTQSHPRQKQRKLNLHQLYRHRYLYYTILLLAFFLCEGVVTPTNLIDKHIKAKN